MNVRKAIFVALSFLCLNGLVAQSNDSEKKILVNVYIHNGDTIPVFHMPTVHIVGDGNLSPKFKWEYDKLKRRVVKVYPYAKTAANLLDQYDEDLAALDKKKDKRKYIKTAEKKLKEEFKGVLKDMTRSEGMILIKLIDRETQHSSYDLLKELRGGSSAFMWQGVARLFGSNLKAKYDPLDEDYLMESIVRKIERGEIQLTAQN